MYHPCNIVYQFSKNIKGISANIILRIKKTCELSTHKPMYDYLRYHFTIKQSATQVTSSAIEVTLRWHLATISTSVQHLATIQFYHKAMSRASSIVFHPCSIVFQFFNCIRFLCADDSLQRLLYTELSFCPLVLIFTKKVKSQLYGGGVGG